MPLLTADLSAIFVNPLLKARKCFHLPIRVPAKSPILDPRLGPNVSYGVLSLTPSGIFVSRYISILAAQLDLQNARKACASPYGID
jgi:hypothetical protein